MIEAHSLEGFTLHGIAEGVIPRRVVYRLNPLDFVEMFEKPNEPFYNLHQRGEDWKLLYEYLRRGEAYPVQVNVEQPDGAWRSWLEFRKRWKPEDLPRHGDVYLVPTGIDPLYIMIRPESIDYVLDHLYDWKPKRYIAGGRVLEPTLRVKLPSPWSEATEGFIIEVHMPAGAKLALAWMEAGLLYYSDGTRNVVETIMAALERGLGEKLKEFEDEEGQKMLAVWSLTGMALLRDLGLIY